MKWIQSSSLTQSEAGRIEQLVQNHGRLVFAIAYSILRNPEDAEDAAQEVFLRIMRYRYRMAFVRDERMFVARIARRTALDRKKAQPDQVAMEEVAEPATREHDPVREEELNLVAALMRTLPEELRQVLELSQVDELTSEEIAAILRIPAGTVRSRLLRAREMLKNKWKARTEKKECQASEAKTIRR